MRCWADFWLQGSVSVSDFTTWSWTGHPRTSRGGRFWQPNKRVRQMINVNGTAIMFTRSDTEMLTVKVTTDNVIAFSRLLDIVF